MSDPVQIHNWLRLENKLTTSGQPSETELGQIKELGVSHVINLALHDHEKSLPDERSVVEELGMEYIHIPVIFDSPTEADFDQFCDEMDRLKNQSVHVHCIVNARVSAFLYRYRRDRLGWDEQDAKEDMEKIWNPKDWKEPGEPWVRFIS